MAKTNRIHNHHDSSNLRLKDSNLFLEDLISYSRDRGIDLVALTDHESVSGHVKAMRLREKYPDIKIALGNEIYLVNRRVHDELKAKNEKILYYHFILVAKNKKGHELIRRLSSEAWEEVYTYRRMERVPTFMDTLQKYMLMDEYKGTVIASTACFLAGTQVNTQRGLVSIEEIKPGDYVLTEDGSYQKVLTPTNRDYIGNIYNIQFKHSSLPVDCTENHKFLVVPHEKDYKKYGYNEKYFEYIYKGKGNKQKYKRHSIKHKPFWLEANKLNDNYDVLCPINDKTIDCDYIDMSKYKTKLNQFKSVSRIDNIKIDKLTLEVLGAFLGDGYISGSGIGFSLNNTTKIKIGEKIVKWGEGIGLNPYIRIRGTKRDININSMELKYLFEDMFGKGAINKKVPEIVKYLPINKQIYFLGGCGITDGSYRKRERGKEFIYCSISGQCIDDLKHMFYRLWINPSLSTTPEHIDKNGIHHCKAYYLKFSGVVAEKFYNFYNNGEEFNITFDDRLNKDFPLKYNNVYYMRNRIKKIEYKKQETKVYCMNVENNHSFVANGSVVHNCLGGMLAHKILNNEDYMPFIRWCKKLFGDDFYLEMQPSHSEEQQKVNAEILKISETYNIPYTITTDSHYKSKEDQEEFYNYLNSQDGDREAEEFYATTYIMGDDELLEFFPQEVIDQANEYNEVMYNSIEDFDLFHSPILPPVFIPDWFTGKWDSMFSSRIDLTYCQKFLNSPHIVDRYYLYLIEEGYKERGRKHDHEEEMQRIEIELEQCWDLSIALGEHISKYHVAIRQIVDEVWKVSLVGPARGSACCFYLNYLIDIAQVNPLDYNLPYWRYMDKTKVELSDKYIVRVA